MINYHSSLATAFSVHIVLVISIATSQLKGVIMHKSYQPILPSTNKLLKKRWDETYYNEHRRLVKTAKPMVDTTAPRQHPHVTSKQKKEQVSYPIYL